MTRRTISKALYAFIVGGITYTASLFGAVYAVAAEDYGLNATASGAGYNISNNTAFANYVGLLINGALGALGVIFLVLIFYGGMLWLTAEGEKDKISKARGFIFHSILGLIVTLFSYAITAYVINLLTNTAGTLK